MQDLSAWLRAEPLGTSSFTIASHTFLVARRTAFSSPLAARLQTPSSSDLTSLDSCGALRPYSPSVFAMMFFWISDVPPKMVVTTAARR